MMDMDVEVEWAQIMMCVRYDSLHLVKEKPYTEDGSHASSRHSILHYPKTGQGRVVVKLVWLIHFR